MDYLRLNWSRRVRLLLAAAGLAVSTTVAAEPLLRCAVTYAGTTHTIATRVVTDPYTVPSVDIGGRFLFRAVMVGTDREVAYIKLYAYFDTRRQPILIQEAKYLPPFRRTQPPYALTGEQHLYAGPLERELIYACTLEGVP